MKNTNIDIYLIRHAESEYNAHHNHKIGGRSSWAELTPKGIEQARALGRRLHQEDLHFDAVYCSPAIRTQQTARYAFEEAGQTPHITLIPSLQELSQGDWEGLVRETVFGRADIAAALAADNWNLIPGYERKGESQAMVAARMGSWLEAIIEQQKGTIAAFTHGMAIKFLLTDQFGYDRQTAYQMPMDNTGISTITYRNGILTHKTHNDTTHLKQL